jgi:hypothetical protein
MSIKRRSQTGIKRRYCFPSMSIKRATRHQFHYGQCFSYLYQIGSRFHCTYHLLFQPHINTGSYVISQKQRSLPSRELLYKPQVLPMASKLATAAASILILALLLVSSGKPFSNYIVVFGLSYVKVK